MLMSTCSSALRDFVVREGSTRRHMLRITPQAERPYFDTNGETSDSEVKSVGGQPSIVTK